MTEERRRHKRLEVDLDASYRVVERDTDFEIAVINISFSGICISMKEELNVGDKLEMKVALETAETVHLIGDVRWCQKADEDGRFKAGITILEGREEGQEKFERYYNLRLLYPPVMEK